MITKWSVPGESRARSGEKLQQRTGKDSHHDRFSEAGKLPQTALEGEWESFHNTRCVLQTLPECRWCLYPCPGCHMKLGNAWYDRQQGLRVTYRVVLLHDQHSHGTPAGDHRPVAAATIQTARIPFPTKELRTAES